jgi:hypothetical protein
MPFSEESESKKKLYEFNSHYLKDLNLIRRQFNLVALSDDDDTVENSIISLPPSPPSFSFNEDLYDCDTDYLQDLNVIRKQLNMKEITVEASDVKNSSVSVEKNCVRVDKREKQKLETKCIFDGHHSENRGNGAVGFRRNHKSKKSKSNKKVENVQATYTPPKKKICIGKESPELAVRADENVEACGEEGKDKSEKLSPVSDKCGRNSGASDRVRNSCKTEECCLETGCASIYSPRVGGAKKKSKSGDRPEGVSDDVESRKAVEELNLLSSPNGPSETSSPVKDAPYTPVNFYRIVKSPVRKGKSQLEEEFCSLNVPTSAFKKNTGSVRPRITILLPEEAETSDANVQPVSSEDQLGENLIGKQLIRAPIGDKFGVPVAGLDLPRISNELHNFPSVVHIARWGNILSQELKDKIFSEKSITKKVKKKINRVQEVDRNYGRVESDVDQLLTPEFPFENEDLPGKKLVDVETISSLNNMYHYKRKHQTEANVESSNATTEETKSDTDEDDVKGGCRCFSLCFIRKPKNYFT